MKTKKPEWLPEPTSTGRWIVKHDKHFEFDAVVTSFMDGKTEIYLAMIPELSDRDHLVGSLTMQGWNRWRKVE